MRLFLSVCEGVSCNYPAKIKGIFLYHRSDFKRQRYEKFKNLPLGNLPFGKKLHILCVIL